MKTERRSTRRTRSGITLVALAAGAALALAAGCASSEVPNAGKKKDPNSDEFVIGYSQANNAEPYRDQLNKQLEKKYLKKYPKLKLLPITDAQQDSGKQITQVRNLLKQGIDVLVVSPNEPGPLTGPVEQACKAKIPVIVLDRSVNTDCYTSFIGGDNVQAGQKAGELALKLLPNGGNVAEITGLKSNQPQKDRNKGFRDAIKKNPKIKVVAAREGKWLKEEGTKVMSQILQRGDKIDLVFAHNDPMALGAQLAAVRAKQPAIKFIGIDGLATSDGGIKAVQDKTLAGSFIYPTGAEEAAASIEALRKGEKVKKDQILDIEPVTPDNATQLFKEYNIPE